MSNLQSIEVSLPLAHFGDLLAHINSIGGLIDEIDPSDPALVRARVPSAAISVVSRWLFENLPKRGEAAALLPQSGH